MNLNIYFSKEHENTAPLGRTKNKVPSKLCVSVKKRDWMRLYFKATIKKDPKLAIAKQINKHL